MTSKSLKGVVAVSAAAAIAGLALVTTGAGPAPADSSLDLTYSCSFPLIGTQTVDVAIDAAVPATATVGTPTAAFPVTATVTVPAAADEGLTLVGATTVSGTATADATVTDGSAIDAPVDLTIPTTDVPPSGSFNVVASGTAPSETLDQAGTATITVGEVTTTLTPLNSSGQPTSLGTFTSDCTLDSGQNNTLATVTVS